MFESAAARDDWRQVGASFAATTWGPNWAVSGNDEGVQEVAEALDAGS